MCGIWERSVATVEPPNNGHVGDEHFVHCSEVEMYGQLVAGGKHFVHCSEVVPSSEVEMYGHLVAGGKQFVHCWEVVLLLECPLSEVLLYMFMY